MHLGMKSINSRSYENSHEYNYQPHNENCIIDKQQLQDIAFDVILGKYENVYHTKFIVRRDYTILNYYKSKIR